VSELGATVARFSPGERWTHRATGLLMGTCLLTAFVLYYGPISLAIGHRHTVELIHVWAGYALPVPLLLGLASSAYRADLRVLNRFSREDWRWLRSKNRRDGSFAVGKFNAGQKLNSALSGGAIVVLLATGTLMYFPDLARLSWRTGATFVHDWFALGLGLLVIGHISYAVRDPGSRRGMRSGSVTTTWARTHHAAWLEEVGAAESAHPRTRKSSSAAGPS
jgi:formate dehydrogenase subunit gamma